LSTMESVVGSLVVVMGKGCVGMASDQKASCELVRIFKVGERMLMGGTGLEEEVTEVHAQLMSHKQSYEQQEGKKMTIGQVNEKLGEIVGESRLDLSYVEPIVMGIDKATEEPYIYHTNVFGECTKVKDFIIRGPIEKSLRQKIEILWRPDMEPMELFKMISKALTNVVYRGATNNWSAKVYILEKDRLTERVIKERGI
ncbi:hypothetical protein KR044_007381, partial [Drosophila immigrans]